jgi:hypothetical protein
MNHAGAAVIQVGAGALDGEKRPAKQGLIASKSSGRLFGQVMQSKWVHLHQFIQG